ncbi:MAG: glucokinase [Pirellulaceae bacterium]|jgi:glucokinase
MAKNDKNWIGFDLGGTKMLAAVLDHEFNVVGTKRKRTRGNEGVDAGLKRIVDTIREAADQAKIDLASIGGIGIGCPGPVDWKKGVLVTAVNLGWENAPLKEYLEKEFNCPVDVLNDVDAGVYGEKCFGAAKDARCVVGVFPGTGIGGGCVYEDQIIRGLRFSCMEIGHIPCIPQGPLSGYGHEGTLEAVASRLAIAAQIARAAFTGQAPHILANAGTSVGDIKSSLIANAIQSGDTMVEKIVRKAARHIGVVLSGTINLLAPDLIVLGGGMVEAMPDLFVDEVTKGVMEFALPLFQESLSVVPAELGDDAAVKGAAAWIAKTVSSS